MAGRGDELPRFRATGVVAEQALAARIVDRLPFDIDGRLRALVAAEVPDDDAGHCVYRGRMENRIRHRNGPPASMGA